MSTVELTPNAEPAGGICPGLEAALAECDERHVSLYLTSVGGVRFHVMGTASAENTHPLIETLRKHKPAIAELLRQRGPIHIPALVPFFAKDLHCLWLKGKAAPPVLFEVGGRTYYRYTPRLYHWIHGAMERYMRTAKPWDVDKVRKRRIAFICPGWLEYFYRRDQIERAVKYRDVLPTLAPGEKPVPSGYIEPVRTPSANRRWNGNPMPMFVPRPLPFELPEAHPAA